MGSLSDIEVGVTSKMKEKSNPIFRNFLQETEEKMFIMSNLEMIIQLSEIKKASGTEKKQVLQVFSDRLVNFEKLAKIQPDLFNQKFDFEKLFIIKILKKHKRSESILLHNILKMICCSLEFIHKALISKDVFYLSGKQLEDRFKISEAAGPFVTDIDIPKTKYWSKSELKKKYLEAKKRIKKLTLECQEWKKSAISIAYEVVKDEHDDDDDDEITKQNAELKASIEAKEAELKVVLNKLAETMSLNENLKQSIEIQEAKFKVVQDELAAIKQWNENSNELEVKMEYCEDMEELKNLKSRHGYSKKTSQEYKNANCSEFKRERSQELSRDSRDGCVSKRRRFGERRSEYYNNGEEYSEYKSPKYERNRGQDYQMKSCTSPLGRSERGWGIDGVKSEYMERVGNSCDSRNDVDNFLEFNSNYTTDKARSVGEEVDRLHRNVANRVMKSMNKYYPGTDEFDPAHHKIGSLDQYTKLAKQFSHQLRTKIKESYQAYHSTLVGIKLTWDQELFIRNEVDRHFEAVSRI